MTTVHGVVSHTVAASGPSERANQSSAPSGRSCVASPQTSAAVAIVNSHDTALAAIWSPPRVNWSSVCISASVGNDV